jgi:uncharacterized membrane protein YcaP (DUF421 family)
MKEFWKDIDWNALLLGEEPLIFLAETAFRTTIMFLVIVFALRLLGKRGIKQLSVFELGVIIGLGSAAGDPMFYKDVGLLPGMVVFTVVMILYRLITYLINRSNRIEQFLEGKPVCMVQKGVLLMENFKKEPIAMDELFSQLRLKSISHLGQVKQAIIETNGEVSVFFYPDDEVKYGLPIVADPCQAKQEAIAKEGEYACTYCGQTRHLEPAPRHQCAQCQHTEWLPAKNHLRIA